MMMMMMTATKNNIDNVTAEMMKLTAVNFLWNR